MFFDNHTHSTFSPDARTTVEESIAYAVSHGLSGIAFTDHLDLDAPARDNEFKFSIAQQQQEIEHCSHLLHESSQRVVCREAEITKLQVFKGIEVGLQPGSLGKIREYVKGFDFDVVIGSVHFVEHLDPYMQTYYEGKDYKRAYSGALEAICKTAFEYRDFDILGHYDYITRYRNYPCRSITLAEFGDYMEPLLKLDLNILKRFKELGGEALSFGSDAHDAFRLGESFEFYAEVVKKCGFTHLAYYKDRKPHFYKI